MKLWIFSDLHLEFGTLGLEFEVPQADICVVAGDIGTKGPARSIEFLAENVPDIPVVFVGGNHEYYQASIIDGLVDGARAASKHTNVHFLENEFVEVGEFTIAGATLWSNFKLMGDQHVAMRYCQETMNDYLAIRWSKQPYTPLRAFHTFRRHVESVEFLDNFLRDHKNRRTLVLTHHAPSKRSISEKYLADTASAAFASDLETMIVERGPELWVHGHVHHRLDYVLGGTRVICNPRGYYGDPNFASFELGYVIDV